MSSSNRLKKNVLFVIHSMNIGGTERALISLLNTFSPDVADVTVLMLESKGGYLNSIPEWVKTETFPDFKEINDLITLPPLYVIKNQIKNRKFDVALNTLWTYFKSKFFSNWKYFYIQALHNFKYTTFYDVAIAFAGPSDFITYLIAVKIHAPLKIQWIHFDIEKIHITKKFGREYYTYFDKIFCVSVNARTVFNRVYPQFSHITETLQNIISEKEILDLSTKEKGFDDRFDGLRILTLGRISTEKGQQMIPKVVRKLQNENINFKWYCIGDGEIRNELQSKIEDLEINDRLSFLGTKLNPYPYMRECDIYVQTSIHEGYGISIHEAKVFNKPIVTTNVVSAENLINNNVTGLIVDVSEDGIFNGVLHLIKNEELRIQFSINLSKEIKDNTKEVEKLISLINQK